MGSTESDTSDGWDAYPAAELTDAIGQLHAAEMALRQRILAMVAAFDAKQGWKDDGATSAAAWLVERLGVSSSTASEMVRVSRALVRLPAIAGVAADGGFSWDQLAALTRFAEPADDDELAVDAPSWPAARLAAVARARREVTNEDNCEAHQRRSLRLWWDERKRLLRLGGRLADVDGAVVAKALERLAAEQGSDPATGAYDPYHQRLADALVNLARTHVADDADAEALAGVAVETGAGEDEGEGGAGEGGADEGGSEAGRADERDAGRVGAATGKWFARAPAETDDGVALAIDTVRRLACDSRVQLVFDGRDGKPVGVGRIMRTTPPWLYRLVRRRDRACRFPGCERRRWVHAHHIVHWTAGGPTDLDNLVLLCTAHHRLVHEEGWHVRGSPGRQLVFVSPYGKALGTGPPRLRPDVRARLTGADPPDLLAG